MLEGDRFEVLDITVRPDSKLVNLPFKELPMTGSLIGAIVRDGQAIFPHGDDMLLPGDRAIIFTESARATEVERAL
jgi:trk system potassium uptake protein TrkA